MTLLLKVLHWVPYEHILVGRKRVQPVNAVAVIVVVVVDAGTQPKLFLRGGEYYLFFVSFGFTKNN